jgi:acyl-CoA synthetase (AMP-forming)/AMP-acid ligase II
VLADLVRERARRAPGELAIAGERLSLSNADLSAEADAGAARLAREGVAPGDRVTIAATNRPQDVVALVAAWRAGAVAVLHASGVVPPEPALAPPDLSALVLFSSGSTGAPRGVVLSHEALFQNALDSARRMRLGPADRCLLLAPVTGRMALSFLLASVAGGGAARLEPGFLAGDGVLARAADATVLPLVPAQLRMMLDRGLLDRSAWPALRLLQVGAGPLSASDVRRARAALPGVELVYRYGSSETGEISVAAGGDLDRPGCVGRPYPEVRVTVVGEDGAPARPGELGELAVESPYQMTGYLDAPPVAGAIRTGDLGRLTREGLLFFEGRLKDVVKAGGENVSAAAVERVLLALPGVADAAAVGVEDPVLGEAVCAIVVASGGASLDAATLRAGCAPHLARVAVPRTFLLVDALPRLSTGKVDRLAVAALARRA